MFVSNSQCQICVLHIGEVMYVLMITFVSICCFCELNAQYRMSSVHNRSHLDDIASQNVLFCVSYL